MGAKVIEHTAGINETASVQQADSVRHPQPRLEAPETDCDTRYLSYRYSRFLCCAKHFFVIVCLVYKHLSQFVSLYIMSEIPGKFSCAFDCKCYAAQTGGGPIAPFSIKRRAVTE